MGCCFSSSERDNDESSKAAFNEGNELTEVRKGTPLQSLPAVAPLSPQMSVESAETLRERMGKVFTDLLCDDDTETRRIQFSTSWEALARLLQVDVEDPLMLLFSAEVHKASSEEVIPMCITEASWTAFCAAHKFTSISALRNHITAQRGCLADPQSEGYKTTYDFAFDFIKEQTARNVPTEDAMMYWKLLVSGTWQYADDWADFMATQNHKVVTRDEWMMLLDLIRAGNKGVEVYDASGSWPLLVDDFFEYLQAKKKKS